MALNVSWLAPAARRTANISRSSVPKLSDFSAVIFDMDGLVLDTETTYFVAWQQAANAMGYELSDSFCLSLSGLHYKDIEPKLMAWCGADFNLQEFNQLSGIFWRKHVNTYGINIKARFYSMAGIYRAAPNSLLPGNQQSSY